MVRALVLIVRNLTVFMRKYNCVLKLSATLSSPDWWWFGRSFHNTAVQYKAQFHPITRVPVFSQLLINRPWLVVAKQVQCRQSDSLPLSPVELRTAQTNGFTPPSSHTPVGWIPGRFPWHWSNRPHIAVSAVWATISWGKWGRITTYSTSLRTHWNCFYFRVSDLFIQFLVTDI